MQLMPCDLFPNGYRYASEAWRSAQRRTPLLVHNNWIVGHEAKLGRFRSWGMWLGGDGVGSFGETARTGARANKPSRS